LEVLLEGKMNPIREEISRLKAICDAASEGYISSFAEYWAGPRCKDRSIWEAKSEELKHLNTWLHGMCAGTNSNKSRTVLPSALEALEVALDALENCAGGDLASGEGIYKAEVAREAIARIGEILGRKG